MFCKKCGKENSESTKFCSSCGAPMNEEHDDFSLKKMSDKDKSKIAIVISIILSVVSVILPFCTWANVPIADNLYSLFGGKESISSYSLFSYTSAANTYSNSFSVILYIVLFFVIIAIAMDLLFIVKFFMKKTNYLKFSKIGSITMLICSIVFMCVIGLSSAVTFNTINMTSLPWIAILVNIANIIVVIIINKLKNQKN